MALPDEIAQAIGIQGMGNAASVLSRPAEEFGNDASLEAAWAVKASEHADVYFNIVCSVSPRLLRLTPHDEEIYTLFRKQFPDLTVQLLTEDLIKNEEAKKEWREFCNTFEGKVEDFSFATLLRLDSGDEYSQSNTVVVPRVQFYAIELARNREGHNDQLKDKFKPQPRTKAR
ncbi:protein PBDC1-like [Amphibalanus amphitrite]|uniref:protein PBDC1-like n=1 Tax=Amphibalanus amphitrite TaxID=1232801 RepID=UPI001C916BF1|nr:protein PBDC1-like [Amphibalanus amphitrite]XP_043222724.1 protein PBDC1-like [Amphibalanus amphitrite]XP_043222725.1 protein PBDC1-like [Amphibalanus amphitrite]